MLKGAQIVIIGAAGHPEPVPLDTRAALHVIIESADGPWQVDLDGDTGRLRVTWPGSGSLAVVPDGGNCIELRRDA